MLLHAKGWAVVLFLIYQPGFLPTTLHGVCQVAYVYIFCTCYSPPVGIISFFYY